MATLTAVVRFRWVSFGQSHKGRPVVHLVHYPSGKEGERPVCGYRSSFELVEDGIYKCLACLRLGWHERVPGGEYMTSKRNL